MAPAGCGCCGCWGGAVAAAGAARRVPVLLLLGVLSAGPRPGALATEHYSPLSLLKQELQHRQQQEAPAGGGCSPQSGDWGDQYSAECGGEWAAAAGGRPGRSGAPGGGALGAAGPGADVAGRPGLAAASRGVCPRGRRLREVSRRGSFPPLTPTPLCAPLPRQPWEGR